MKKNFIIILLILVAAALLIKESRIKRPSEPLQDGCVSCHGDVKDPDPSHPVSVFGCYICHLGNRYSLDRDRAHFTMVRNPGDLRVVDRTCGKGGCHSDIVARVKNSVMATNRGIIGVIQEQWLNSKKANGAPNVVRAIGVGDLYGKDPPSNLAIDHYRKMCGGCHLWKERGDREGEVGRRGGGCSNCHVLDEEKKGSAEKKTTGHPKMTTRIPSRNCIKCHNRSARIGLSYFGRFESAGYGTPYEGNGLSGRRLSGNRFFLNLQADIHFSKANMECIDCHTATGLMGDGRQYDKMAAQIDISCQACHSPKFSVMEGPESLAGRLAFLNKRVPRGIGKSIALSKKGTPLYNLQRKDGKVIFYRKMDGLPVEMDIRSSDKPHHGLKGHERLACQSCHSAWIPQCYGCHLTYRKSERQTDWITHESSPGRWKEARSYLRFSRPALGIRNGFGIYPISPCQVFVSVFDSSGRFRKDQSFKTMNISAFDPHTTSKKSRTCIECHQDPKVIGLGEGILHQKGSKRVFRATYDSSSSGIDVPFPLDGFVDLSGEPLQTDSGKGVRPFNREEIDRILGVAPCLGCHPGYDDRIYGDFRGSKERFEIEAGLPCLK
ncbi:MAG: hypothetical protein KJ573_10450 [Proteobacteria bacterium]|nr:hypothetical protein [Desulfobacteraceae bacterium]MBL7171283.1 hypothetical protein [Desulfobacteraceae bacterium]MBU0735361.1 hypothetical protein [Pseudomonadota bacterium]MBU1903997.1 hypothetical protein [Pseudomonadota bacterium]